MQGNSNGTTMSTGSGTGFGYQPVVTPVVARHNAWMMGANESGSHHGQTQGTKGWGTKGEERNRKGGAAKWKMRRRKCNGGVLGI
jgi:hypothetical protein